MKKNLQYDVKWNDERIKDIFDASQPSYHNYIEAENAKTSKSFTSETKSILLEAQRISKVGKDDKLGNVTGEISDNINRRLHDKAQSWVRRVIAIMQTQGYDFAGFANAVMPSYVWMIGQQNVAETNTLMMQLDARKETLKRNPEFHEVTEHIYAASGVTAYSFLKDTPHIVIRAGEGAIYCEKGYAEPIQTCQISDMFFIPRGKMSKYTLDYTRNRMLNGLEFAAFGQRGATTERLTERENDYIALKRMGALPTSNYGINIEIKSPMYDPILVSSYKRPHDIKVMFGALDDIRNLMRDAKLGSYLKFFNAEFTAIMHASEYYMEPRDFGYDPYKRQPNIAKLLQITPSVERSRILEITRKIKEAGSRWYLYNMKTNTVDEMESINEWKKGIFLTSMGKLANMSSICQSWTRSRLQIPMIAHTRWMTEYLAKMSGDIKLPLSALYSIDMGYNSYNLNNMNGYFKTQNKLEDMNQIVAFFL